MREGESTEVQVIPKDAPQAMPPMIVDPQKQVEYGQKASKALMAIVEQKPKKVVIQGKQYLTFEDWQTLARFFNYTVGTDWTKILEGKDGKAHGFWARAVVYHNGTVVSAAEASCTRDEKRWSAADEYAIRSMAQTRACAKALRNVLSWVAVLAGYEATPAEEIPEEGFQDTKARPVQRATKPAPRPAPPGPYATPTKIDSIISKIEKQVPGITYDKLVEMINKKFNVGIEVVSQIPESLADDILATLDKKV